jgi:DNA-binding NarL/FixJ family response regulator
VLQITPKEREALQLLARGSEISQIAGRFGLSTSEFETSLSRLFTMMGATTPSEAIAAALKRGLLSQR